MSHSTVRAHLSDAIHDAHKGTGKWANYIDHTGDGKTGDCIYSVDGDTMSAPYTITSGASKQTASVDTASAKKVIPVVSYKKQETAVGEAALSTGEGIRLIETMPWASDILLSESVASGVEREIRIIVPCKGSTAVYTEAALRKSAKAFTVGTQMFINHATKAEEAQRPEGDWRKLVGQLTSPATYKESHASGAGLYANAKFASSVAPEILEKASMSGVSIRANGKQATEAGRLMVQHGLPVLEEITSVESIDIVTRAGAGGLILTEGARTAPTQQEDDMSDAEKAELREAARVVREGRARAIATAALAGISLMEAGKSRVIDLCVRTLPMKDGVLDEAKLTETVTEEAKREGAYLASIVGTGVRGMGAPAQVVAITEAQRTERAATEERQLKESTSIFADLMGNSKAAVYAAKGRAA